MKRAALYIRVSTDEQARHGYSLDAQRETLTQYAASHDFVIVDYYVDDGYSARKKYTTRPQCLRMLQDVEAGRIDTILFIKLDRWFRNVKEYYKVQEILDRCKVTWQSVLEDYDTATATGQLNVNIMLSIAQNESDRTSERIKYVFENKLSRKEFTTGILPMGFKLVDKHLFPDERADIVREIYSFYETHQSQYAVIKHLRENFDLNVPEASMRKILSNPLYKGEYNGIQDFCEPILPPGQYERVQEIKQSRSVRRPATGEIYIFSSLVVCAECGHNLVGYRHTPKKITFRYYRCNQYANRRLCNHSHLLNELDLEEYLLNNSLQQLRQYISNCEKAQKAPQRKGATDTEKIAGKMSRLKELYVDGLITKADYLTDYEKMKTLLDKLPPQKPYTAPANMERLKLLASANYTFDNYSKLNREERRVFWRGFIRRIEVDDSHNITIFFD